MKYYKWKGYRIIKVYEDAWYVECKKHNGCYIGLWSKTRCRECIDLLVSHKLKESDYPFYYKEELKRGC